MITMRLPGWLCLLVLALVILLASLGARSAPLAQTWQEGDR